MGQSVHLLWVPACRGIKGREMADKSVKNAAVKEASDVEVSLFKTELKILIKMEMKGGVMNRKMAH